MIPGQTSFQLFCTVGHRGIIVYMLSLLCVGLQDATEVMSPFLSPILKSMFYFLSRCSIRCQDLIWHQLALDCNQWNLVSTMKRPGLLPLKNSLAGWLLSIYVLDTFKAVNTMQLCQSMAENSTKWLQNESRYLYFAMWWWLPLNVHASCPQDSKWSAHEDSFDFIKICI